MLPLRASECCWGGDVGLKALIGAAFANVAPTTCARASTVSVEECSCWSIISVNFWHILVKSVQSQLKKKNLNVLTVTN